MADHIFEGTSTLAYLRRIICLLARKESQKSDDADALTCPCLQPDAKDKFMECKRAYQALSDTKQRSRYDREQVHPESNLRITIKPAIPQHMQTGE